MLRSLADRRRQSELMDDPAIEFAVHKQALVGLSRINWWSRSGVIIWSAIRPLLVSQPRRTWKILDIACGSGDVTCEIARRAEKLGIQVHMLGVDCSDTAISLARQRAAARPHAKTCPAEIQFEMSDVLNAPLPSDFDIVMCSLFFHHLEDAVAEPLLARMATAAKSMVLVNDLRRTQLGYALAWLGCRVLSRSSIVHFDGPVSVEGAYTDQEFLALASRAGLGDASLTHHWPQRFLFCRETAS